MDEMGIDNFVRLYVGIELTEEEIMRVAEHIETTSKDDYKRKHLSIPVSYSQ